MKPQYLTAKEVTDELGISFNTLYSYVSRGLIRSEETGGATRHKQYWAEDVAALRNRRDRKRNPTTSAATALDVGDPVLESDITLIEEGRLYYRGQDAVTLAQRHAAEEVAGLLWTGKLEAQLLPLATEYTTLQSVAFPLLAALPDTLTPIERFHVLLPIAEAHDLAAHEKSQSGICRTATHIYALLLTALRGELPHPERRLAQHLAAWQTYDPSPETTLHPHAENPGLNYQSQDNQAAANSQAFSSDEVNSHARQRAPLNSKEVAGQYNLHSESQSGMDPDTESSLARLLDAALILCADHELNVSSFTARCVASTGAPPYGAVAAALAALQGPRHGGDTARCEILIREAQANPRQALAAWLRRGERLPGFGHRLYPHGDPRAQYLLERLRQIASTARFSHLNSTLATVEELIQQVERTFNLRPNIDMALATIALAFQMPSGAGVTLFAAGRLMGWIAHIAEQYTTDALIRPRARYKGPTP